MSWWFGPWWNWCTAEHACCALPKIPATGQHYFLPDLLFCADFWRAYRVQNNQKPICVQYWILCCRPMVFIFGLLLIRLAWFLKRMISWLSRIIIWLNSHTIKKCYHGQNKYHRSTQNNWVGYQISTGGRVFWPKSIAFGGLLGRGGGPKMWAVKYY